MLALEVSVSVMEVGLEFYEVEIRFVEVIEEEYYLVEIREEPHLLHHFQNDPDLEEFAVLISSPFSLFSLPLKRTPILTFALWI